MPIIFEQGEEHPGSTPADRMVEKTHHQVLGYAQFARQLGEEFDRELRDVAQEIADDRRGNDAEGGILDRLTAGSV